MEENRFRPGWGEQGVREVLAHYESQTDEEAVAEDEAASQGDPATIMKIPSHLVPAVRELLARGDTPNPAAG